MAAPDLALVEPLPKRVRQSVTALVGCVSGAVLMDETRAMAKAAGLSEIALTPKPGYVEGMADWNDPLYRGIIKNRPEGKELGDYVTSLYVSAKKHAARRRV